MHIYSMYRWEQRTYTEIPTCRLIDHLFCGRERDIIVIEMSSNIGMRMGAIEYRRFMSMSREEQARHLVGMGVVLTLITSILILCTATRAPTHCTRGVFLWPCIAIGLFFMVVFILGLCAAKNNNEDLFACHLLGVFIAILALIGFIIFGYVAIGPGIDLSDVKAREYNLDDYKSGWLRARVDDAACWATTSACLRGDRGAGCNAMTKLVRDPDSGLFVPDGGRWHADMSPIQSGCCKPPSSCGFTYVNGTTWTPTPAAATNNVDCSRWSNDQQKLCFQCDSCKAGFLDHTRKAWSSAAFFPIYCLISAILSCWSGLRYGSGVIHQ
ncbi:tetraspanin-3-like [Oryza glaberrima]|nr:tetraspanin-3-like [Oryza glaberrima]